MTDNELDFVPVDVLFNSIARRAKLAVLVIEAGADGHSSIARYVGPGKDGQPIAIETRLEIIGLLEMTKAEFLKPQ